MALTLTAEPAVKSVRVDVTVPGGHDRLTVARAGPSGEVAVVRGWESQPVVAGAVMVRDYEPPIGVPLTYTAETWDDPGGAHTSQTGTITLTSDGCGDTWLTDLARVGNSQLVTLEHLEELAYPVPTSVHSIIGRRTPIISGDVAHTPSFELAFLTDTPQDREQARAALGNGVPVLLRTPPENGIGNLYFAVTEFAEQRIVTGATEQARRFVVAGTQVQRPDPSLYLPLTFTTYASVLSSYATYAQLLSDRATYDAVLYDWTGAQASDVIPWPPADV